MTIKPEDALRAVAEHTSEDLVVPTMTAGPAWRDIAPESNALACVGFMGGASSIGLGLALAEPGKRIVVLDGDGSLLMQLGSLATIAGAAPSNLIHVLFNNGVYHTSGSQEIPGGADVDFAGLAKAAGYNGAVTIDDLEDLRIRLPELLNSDGPFMIVLKSSEADKTPMTAPGGKPFWQQAVGLRERLGYSPAED
jgi:thiamine pyrophosphate-dependent acetolactate synthase large subunit-like protein